MAVVGLEVGRRELLAGGRGFGAIGAYQRIDGAIRFAADPADPANASIVDLDKAARDGSGRVPFWADFTLLQPADPAWANRRLLFYVVNRGQRAAVPMSRAVARPATEPPTDEIDPGDAFLLERGWTIAMCGWQWDVERRPGLMALEAPQALGPDGQPIQGQIAVMFQPNELHPDQILSHFPQNPRPGKVALKHRPYPAADVGDPEAVLTVREHPTAERRTIARERWRFAREVDGRPVADDSYVWLAGGFQPGLMYEVVYRTRVCPVVGTGLLAVRDCTSFLRYGSTEAGNPCAGQVDYAYGFGISQCGRFLRQYLYDSLNLDEAGRQVFDGLIPHVAGARRGEFNHRFAQPSAQHALGFGHLFPFASDDQTDQVTHVTDGLLRRQRALGGVPKIFTTNTSSEYWRIDCSLVHTDPAGTVDLEPPPEERIYMIAGHRHGPGALPLNGVDAPLPNGARTADPQTVVDGSPVIRAFLINLDRWVSEGVEPPASAFPRLADGSAVPRERVLDRVAGIPGVTPLDRALLPTLSRIDLGADASRGVGQFPAATGAPYPSYVSDVDADGNEMAGIRTPEVSVPVGTHTGWVTRHRATGGAGQLVDMLGLTSPLSATAAERSRRGDPRPSIEERYGGRDDYAARARAAAEQLAAERYVVAEDVEVLVATALERYDAFARQPVGAAV